MIELNASFWMVLRLLDVKLMQEKKHGSGQISHTLLTATTDNYLRIVLTTNLKQTLLISHWLLMNNDIC